MKPITIDVSPSSSTNKQSNAMLPGKAGKKRPYEEVSSSEVHFPHFTQLRRLAAAKLIESSIDYVNIQNEASLLTEFKHENIIQLYAVFQGEQSGLVLELMEGGSMNELLHQNKHVAYQACHVLGWTLQTASALGYLHGRGYVHRDLKPSNLLLTYDYFNLKLCDFGTAADLRTTMTNNRGSAAWMAPEVFRGKNYDQKCDIYSFGILVWEMISRRTPFDDCDSNAYGILWQASGGRRPEPIVDCPAPITDLMQRCWADEPQDRPYIVEVSSIVEVLCEIYPNRYLPLLDKSTGQQALAETGSRRAGYYPPPPPQPPVPTPPTFNRSPSIPPPLPPPPKLVGHRRGGSQDSAKLLRNQVHIANPHSAGDIVKANGTNPYTPNTQHAQYNFQSPTPNASPYNPCMLNSTLPAGYLPPPPPMFTSQLSGPSTSSNCSAVRQSTSTSASEDGEGRERRCRKKSHGLMRFFNGIKKEF